jgi:hypothetical protein
MAGWLRLKGPTQTGSGASILIYGVIPEIWERDLETRFSVPIGSTVNTTSVCYHGQTVAHDSRTFRTIDFFNTMLKARTG